MVAAAPALTFETQAGWEAWLDEHAGSTASGVWLRLAKKGSGHQTVSYAQALESALCHGWIDGQKKAESDAYWLQKFTPRGRRSIWSKINTEKATALIEAGRMKPAGLQEVARAREDGRWKAAYPSTRTSAVPADLQAALDANPEAAEFFAALDSRNRYAILFRIHNVRKEETRARKIAQYVAMLAGGERLHP